MKKYLLTIFIVLAATTVAASNIKIKSDRDVGELIGDREAICTISFAVNSVQLDGEAEAILTKIVPKLKALDLNRKMVRIEGFASPDGDRKKNYQLSLDRARAVERFLRIEHGVSLDHYITGFGPTAPKGLDAAGKRSVQIAIYDNPWDQEDIPVKVTGGQ